ncbi:hypothetical protein [Variovorax ginsengisoli]|uniref:Uncharacterized protein n=1 Tax=Variovorax ginsengisoli TaxID=363844 RepID=A0ABT8S9K8_9BURK|nr:hypothetical protein [Variovorax ginsengisoli]MDN8616418.1 hypothetical protein [Variovorax ginsengisoli]MDO1535588.1 hypothetical protein [Variovorax ginsengisoli]
MNATKPPFTQVEPSALDASVAELEAFDARETSEPLSQSEGESLSLVLHELKRLRAQAAPVTTPDPVVVSEQDLETLDYVEELVRSSGFADKADRLARMHEVLNRVAQGREASHYRESYERAVQRLVLMRQLIPAEGLRGVEVEWRTRKREPLADAAELNLPDVVRGELRQMAEHCGAVSYQSCRRPASRRRSASIWALQISPAFQMADSSSRLQH